MAQMDLDLHHKKMGLTKKFHKQELLLLVIMLMLEQILQLIELLLALPQLEMELNLIIKFKSHIMLK